MKELTIEEKAKRYDEVREKIVIRFGSNVADEIFSQFEMSEDERIRKNIISWLKNIEGQTIPINDYNSAIAWLEKQDKSIDIMADAVLDDNKDGLIADTIRYKKQIEQKSEPKFKVKYAGSEYNVLEVKDIAGVTFYGIEDEPNHIDYVKAENCEIISGYGIKENGSPYPTKPAVFSEQKPKIAREEVIAEVREWIDVNYVRYLDVSAKGTLTANIRQFITDLKQAMKDE